MERCESAGHFSLEGEVGFLEWKSRKVCGGFNQCGGSKIAKVEATWTSDAIVRKMNLGRAGLPVEPQQRPRPRTPTISSREFPHPQKDNIVCKMYNRRECSALFQQCNVLRKEEHIEKEDGLVVNITAF